MIIRGNKASKKGFVSGQGWSDPQRIRHTGTMILEEHRVVFVHPSYQSAVKEQPVDYYGQEKCDLAGKEEFQDGDFTRQ